MFLTMNVQINHLRKFSQLYKIQVDLLYVQNSQALDSKDAI